MWWSHFSKLKLLRVSRKWWSPFSMVKTLRPKKVMESFFCIKNFDTVMLSFFSIKNFKSSKKVTALFSVLKTLKVVGHWWNSFLSFKSFKSCKKVTKSFQGSCFIKLSYDAQISWNNILSVTSHWISLIIITF